MSCSVRSESAVWRSASPASAFFGWPPGTTNAVPGPSNRKVTLSGIRRMRMSRMCLTILWVRVALYGAFIFLGGYALSQTGDAIAGQTGITSAVVGFALIGRSEEHTSELQSLMR